MVTPVASRVIPAHEYRRVRWRNGAGWTREIHAESADMAGYPDDVRSAGGDTGIPCFPWTWRLSIAEIEQAAAFSCFPGMRRMLLLLRGESLDLRFGDGERHVLSQSLARLEFDGGRALEAMPGEGIIHVFNAIWDPQSVDMAVLHRPLVGPMLFFAGPGECWALHLLSGQAGFDGADLPDLAAGDTVLLRDASARRWLLDGGGELLALRIQARPGPS